MRYTCPQPFCSATSDSPGYCEPHKLARERERQRVYDTTKRDNVARAFYGSAAWSTFRLVILALRPTCEACGKALSNDVHHVAPLLKAWARRLDPDNVQAVCTACHRRIERYRAKTGDLSGSPEVFVDE